MIKTIFLDVDNTFYDHSTNSIPEKHIEAIHALKEKGYKLCICTGRPMVLLEELEVDQIFDWDGYVCGNGSLVFDSDKNLIYENTIPKAAAKQIFDLCEKKGVGIYAVGNHKFLTLKNEVTEEIREYFHFANDYPIRTMQEDDRFSNLVFKLDNGVDPVPEIEAIEGIEPVYMPQCIDVKKKGISKYKGIEVLMERFHEDPHEYLAFGDSYIDLEMLQNAKIGVAMENADPRLKEHADSICPSCHNGGIYTYLKENHWI